MSKELDINETYFFEDLRVVPLIDQQGNKYLKIYADNSVIIHPVSDNAVTVYNQK
jgi:hypothetical protein